MVPNIILLIILALVSHIHSLTNGFALDDYSNILNNSLIKDPSSWLQIFYTPHYPGNLYRPVTQLSYALTYYIVGENPFLYHLTNLVIHTLVTILSYFLLRRILTGDKALIAASLFALFPIHGEAIANISGRAELLSAVFLIGALLLSLDKPRVLTLIASSISVLLALLSKENAICAPLLLILTAIYLKKPKKDIFITVSPICLGIFIYLAIRLNVIGSFTNLAVINPIDNPLIEVSFLKRIFIAISLLGRYILLTILPFRLSADYAANVFDLNNQLIFISYLTVLIAAIFLVYKKYELRFGLLWFLFAFTVTSNVLFPIGTIFAERLAYIPALGIASIFSSFICSRIALSALALFYCSINFLHDYVWTDNETLHTYQLSVSPESAKTLLNYGVLERNRGDFDSATKYINSAIEIFPTWSEALYVRATIAAQSGDISKITSDLERALESTPNYVPALNLLGRIKLNDKNFAKARELFERSYALVPENSDSVIGLVAVSVSEKKFDEVMKLIPKLKVLAKTNKEAELLLSKLYGVADPVSSP